MSMIDKMSIMGIRAFGPDDRDQQVIRFQHPLTLLVGPNGAGKTTIIECLKYATTGDQPQNTKGGAFVHDPKFANETEIKAKVRLQCRNVKGEMIVVERSMMAIQKASSIQFKTLDGVLSKKKKNDEVAHLTSKCAELNKQMVEELGVSKAVLEHVIFCHQEESNWPLSEGKSVKQKFDDIFAATRYIKALEEIRKVQKSQKADLRDNKVESTHLKVHCEGAAEKRRNLQTTETKLQASKVSAEKITQQIKPLETNIIELRAKQSKIEVMSGQVKATKSRLQQMLDDEKKLKSRIKNTFHGTDEQLAQLQNDQEKIVDRKRSQQLDCEHQLQPMEEQINRFSKQKMKYSVEQGELQQLVKNAEEHRKHRDELIRGSSEEYNISLPYIGSDLSSQEATTFLHLFQTHADNEENKLQSLKVRLDGEQNKVEESYQESWQMKVELEEGNKHLKKNLMELKEKKARTTRDLNRLQSAADNGQLDVLQNQLQQAEDQLKKAERSNQVEEMKGRIIVKNKEMVELQQQVKHLDADIYSMQKSSEIRTKLEMMKKQKKSKEDLINQLKRKCQRHLEELGLASHSSFPDKMKMMRWIRSKEEEVRSSRDHFDRKRSEFTEISTNKKMVSNQIKEKKKREEKLNETLYDVCGSDDLEQDLTQLDKEIKELQGSKGWFVVVCFIYITIYSIHTSLNLLVLLVLLMNQYMYREFIKKLTHETDKSEAACPICMRCFEETTEVDELVEDLQTKLNMAPEKLASQKRQLTNKQARYQVLLDNKPIKMELDRLQTSDLPDLEQSFTIVSSKINDAEKDLEEAEERWQKIKEEESTAKRLLPDVSQIHSLQSDLQEIDEKIGMHETQLPLNSLTKTLDQMNVEKGNLSQAISKLNQEIDDLRHMIETKTNFLHQMKEKVNNIQAEKLKLAADLQKCEQLQELQRTTESEIQNIRSKIELNERSIAPLVREVENLESKKKIVASSNNDKITKARDVLQTLQNKLKELERVNKNIENFNKSSVPTKLQRTSKEIEELESKIVDFENKMKKLRTDIARLQKEIATCTDRQRDLEDNSALRERNREIEDVRKKLVEMEEKLGGMNAAKLDNEVRQLTKEHSDLTKEKERCKVRQESLGENVRALQQELSRENFKFADKRYKDCLVSATTLELAIGDLDKYYKALDRAVMKYHQIKMDEINKIIRELWQETYKGRDIEYIQICSSEDTGGSTAARRTFNYRVVMYCYSGTPMDMRGRCSAGQKVLASLVIRLALAETFCINCGILALDEPTTNLDRPNVLSLAEALLSIIQSRSQQRNFQLVVITHDEEFVEIISRSNHVDHFFRVEKDDCGRSRITKCPIRSLNT
ncbi:DNA repair protein RAD50 [Ciona intestinalis]